MRTLCSLATSCVWIAIFVQCGEGFHISSLSRTLTGKPPRLLCGVVDLKCKQPDDVRVARRDIGLLAAFCGGIMLRPPTAFADMTLETFKRAYYRYVPRIEAGRDFYVLDLHKMIDDEAWPDILKLFEKKSAAQVCLQILARSARSKEDSLLPQEGSVKAQINLDVKVAPIEQALEVPMLVLSPAYTWMQSISSIAETRRDPRCRPFTP